MSSSGDLNVTDLSKSDLNSGNSYYLCFTISQRTNKMMMNGNDRYSEEQENTYKLIKSLLDEGLGYRKISKILNDKGIKTSKGNTWKNTQVHSVLKRYKERLERLELINKEYEPEWGRMRITSEKSIK